MPLDTSASARPLLFTARCPRTPVGMCVRRKDTVMKKAERKTLKVYDTITKKMVDVEVTQEVYEAYTRSVWREKKSNSNFYENEIQFSMLVKENHDELDSFREFVSKSNFSFYSTFCTSIFDDVKTALSKLKKPDRDLIELIFYCQLTESECSKLLGTSQQNINKRKKRILADIHKLLKG